MISSDLLSDMLASLRIESTGITMLSLSSPWGIKVEQNPTPSLFSVLEGRCILSLDSGASHELLAGDVVLLSADSPGSIACDYGTSCESFQAVWESNQLPEWARGKHPKGPLQLNYGGGGPKTVALSLLFSFQETLDQVLLMGLPEIILIKKNDHQTLPWLEPTLNFIRDEAKSEQPGYVAIATRLAELLFVHMLRSHILINPGEGSGWLRGATDQRIAKAISALHTEPGRNWTVESLAQIAGMSRSAFAVRFQSLLGQTPLKYLTSWRMHLASVRLGQGERSLSVLAQDLGYSSSHAFSHAFKRELGVAPIDYRRYKSRKEN